MISDQERQRRSDQAKRQWANGILRPAHQRKASALAAEAKAERSSAIARRLLEDHAAEVEKTLLNILKSGSNSEKLKAMDIMVKAGLRGESAQLAEVQAQASVASSMSRDELLRTLSEKLTSGPTGALMRAQLDQQDDVVVDAEIIEP